MRFLFCAFIFMSIFVATMSSLQPSLWKRLLLYLPSQLFGGISWLRNKAFDSHLLATKQFDIPTICIGNISVGGTGKTPHTEYIIRLLLGKKQLAVLSRGYKRKTSGFVLADGSDTAQTIGDEPFQMQRKFPEVTVAVDEKRVHGIEQLLTLPAPPEVILLDDAFQHRHVTPSFSVVLVDYNRPIHTDTYLPLGRLRESAKGLSRAHCVIVTKCPTAAKLDETVWRKALQLSPNQSLFFSTFAYEAPKPLFNGKPLIWEADRLQKPHVLVVTGIVSATGLYDYVTPFAETLHTLSFSDHHDFTKTDLETIRNAFDRLPEPKLIITTEKDAARLLHNPSIPAALKPFLYAVGIQVTFVDNTHNTFDDLILDNLLP